MAEAVVAEIMDGLMKAAKIERFAADGLPRKMVPANAAE